MSELGRFCCFNCPKPDQELKALTDRCPDCGYAYGFPLFDVPKSIGKFEVQRSLGRGFYGAAFVAKRQGAVRAQRVLKVSPKAMYSHFNKSFEDEVTRHSEVAEGSEFIVGVEDLFEADITFGDLTIPCHVAELHYLDGEPLQAYLNGSEPLSASEAAQIACDLFRMREEFEVRLKNHNDLHAANIVVQRLPKSSWRRGDAIEPAIRAMAIDLGSVAEDRRSGGGYVGDLHWIVDHITKMAFQLLEGGDNSADLEKRIALKLLSIAQSLTGAIENQRPPSAEDMVRLVTDEYHLVAQPWRPWRNNLVLRRFEESFNAQTMDAWYVPELLVDPDGKWIKRVSAPGPLVMTGMRGCGKTMLLQSVQFHARATLRVQESDAQALKRISSDGYVGLFVSAQRLIPVGSSAKEPSAAMLNARLLVAYAAAAARAIAHLSDLNGASVAPDAPSIVAKAVADVISPAIPVAEPATIEQLERYLIDLLVRMSRNDSLFELATTPATAFPHLAEAVRKSSPIWQGSQVLFLLDDVSTRYLDSNKIEELLSALIFQHPTCAFKLTSEAQTIFLTLKSPGQLHPASAGRDFQTFDLGAEVYETLKRPGGGKAFINNVLRARAKFYSGHPSAEPRDVLGDIDLESIAKTIVSSQPTSTDRKRLYWGLSALAGVCVGDIGSVIQIYQQILARRGKALPVPPQIQNDAFQDFCARYLYHLDRRGSDLKAVAMSFAEASYQLLMQSGKDPASKRLRQYNSIYIRITSGDVEEQMMRLRDLVDAGVFVFTGAAPRTKTRDSNPTQQFQLTYRKIYGLVNFIGLSERDRFELSGDGLQEWLAHPTQGRELLVKNLAKREFDEEHGAAVEETTEAKPRKFERSQPVQLMLLEHGAPTTTSSHAPSFGKSPITIPTVSRLSRNDLPAHVDTLVVGLGFEERTAVSFERLLERTRPSKVLAVRYENQGYADRMLGHARAKGIAVEETFYAAVKTGDLPSIVGEAAIDVTGLAKPALFNVVRQAVRNGSRSTLAYTAAGVYSPRESDLTAVLEAHASYNRHDTLAALKNVLTGEQGPYKSHSLLTTETDGTRSRGLCAFASAKHERILRLIEQREYDVVEIMVDQADTARAKVAEMAATVALEECRAGEIVAADAVDLEAVLRILWSRHQQWYVKGGLNFELGLTGNKIQATAAAIVSALLPVNEVWYLEPAKFDVNGFTQGTGDSYYYNLPGSANALRRG
ncbi:ORC-CDC6 family AAA ATPase [Rhizobium leguminosarum]